MSKLTLIHLFVQSHQATRGRFNTTESSQSHHLISPVMFIQTECFRRESTRINHLHAWINCGWRKLSHRTNLQLPNQPANVLFYFFNLTKLLILTPGLSFVQDIKTCVDDLNNLLKVDPKNSAALKLLQEVQKKKWGRVGDPGEDAAVRIRHCTAYRRRERKTKETAEQWKRFSRLWFRDPGACVSQKLLHTEHTFDPFHRQTATKRELGSRDASGKRSSGRWEVRVCQEQCFYFTSFSVTEYLWIFKRAEMIYDLTWE